MNGIMFTTVIDYREKALNALLSAHMTIASENLHMGDIQIRNDEKIELIIERKTVSDLNSSIRDGRYHEQKQRLLSNIDRNRIVYIVEGTIPENSRYIEKDKVYSGILHSMFRDGLTVYRTEGLVESAQFIIELVARMNKKPEDWLVFLSCQNEGIGKPADIRVYDKVSCKKSDNNTPDVAFGNMLAQIPGCSTKIGTKLVESFKTMAQLIKELETGGEQCLKDFPLDNRKLGPALSSRIYFFLLGGGAGKNPELNM